MPKNEKGMDKRSISIHPKIIRVLNKRSKDTDNKERPGIAAKPSRVSLIITIYKSDA